MKTTITAAAAAAASLVLLSSCASREDGPRMTWAERWRAMAERQDAAARAFVDTGMEPADANRAAARGWQGRAAPAGDAASF